MNLQKIVRAIGPVIAFAAAAGLAACDGVDINVNGDFEGVPLAELDMSGDPPEGVALAGPDTVVITSGDEFRIDVEGSDTARDRMRFQLDDDMLIIGREQGSWRDNDVATVNVTMPTPSSLVIGGSGELIADGLAGDEATIVIGGSGEATVSDIDAGELSVVVGGSGEVSGSGRADSLELVIGGSGSANLDEVEVGNAQVNIGGSGSARFASDGEVEANIAGSGVVRVRGSANCTANTLGSGSLECEEGVDGDTDEDDESVDEAA